MIKKIVCILLIVALFVTTFASCGNGAEKGKTSIKKNSPSSQTANKSDDSVLPEDNTESDDTSAKNEDDGSPNSEKYAKSKKLNLLSSSGEFLYNIIYPKGMPSDQTVIARKVYRSANSLSNGIPNYKADSDVPANSKSKEILIGLTNRTESKTAQQKLLSNRANSYYDYIIMVSGNKIIIYAESTSVLSEAVTFFNKTFLSEDGPNTIPADYLYIRADDIETNMKIAGTDISNYLIVCEEAPSAIVYNACEDLQKSIKKVTDYTVPIVKTSNPQSIKNRIQVTVSGADPNAYSVAVNGNNLIITGGHNSSLAAGVYALSSNISQVSSNQTFNIPKTYKYSGTYTNKTPMLNNYHLVFADEFNSGFLNTKEWSIDDKEIMGQSTEEIKRIYTKDCVTFENGNLVLNTKIRKTDNGRTIYNAGIQGKTYFQFGLFEIRAKINKGDGVYPAFWASSGKSLARNYSAEIDVFEFFYTDLTAACNIHSWWNAGRRVAGHVANDTQIAAGHIQHLNKATGNTYSLPSGAPFSDGYHTYSCEWTPNVIKFYIDGYNYCTQSLDSFLKDATYGYSVNEYMFFLNKSIHTLISCTIGKKKDDYTLDNIDLLPTDTKYMIDWYHLYQMDGIGSYGEVL